jgi:hypothetical protein
VARLQAGWKQTVIQELDPQKPALAVEVQDHVSTPSDGVLDHTLADGLASPNLSQVEITGIDVPVPRQTECHLLIPLTR